MRIDSLDVIDNDAVVDSAGSTQQIFLYAGAVERNPGEYAIDGQIGRMLLTEAVEKTGREDNVVIPE